MKQPALNRNLHWIHYLLAASILLGIVLRFLWVQDMEYKFDEQYMFARSQAVGVSEPWPTLGMPSGVGLRNPGMSIWIFVALARIAGITTPIGLAQSVIVLNCLALLALAYMIFRFIARSDREAWIWGAILVSVNPIAIQLQRKIWAQSVLPFFCVLFLCAWMKRRGRLGALFWGFLGAIIGQIHMSGLFFAAGFFLWTAWNDRVVEQKGARKVRWRQWLLGSCVGALGLIPWISYVLTNHGGASSTGWEEWFKFRFWRNWAAESMGFSVSYSLGPQTFRTFLKGPVVDGVPTYGLGFAQALALITGVAIISIGISYLWKDRDGWKARVAGAASETALAQSAGFWGYGSLITAARVFVHRHYLIVLFPLQYVWIGRMALSKARVGRVLLLGLWAAQLAISIGFLAYIHKNGGATEGDYGVAFSAQPTSAPAR